MLRLMSFAANTVPVTIITGFLGSGKTTVLNHLLRLPSLADTVVIVNEFGDVGLDHLLIEQAIEDAVLLKNADGNRHVVERAKAFAVVGKRVVQTSTHMN